LGGDDFRRTAKQVFDKLGSSANRSQSADQKQGGDENAAAAEKIFAVHNCYTNSRKSTAE